MEPLDGFFADKPGTCHQKFTQKEGAQVPKGKPLNPQPTARQQAYILALLKGMTQRDAYREAYPASRTWKNCTVDSVASKLIRVDYIQSRLEDLRQKLIITAADKGIMTAAEVLQEVSAVAKANVADYLRVERVDVVKGYELDSKGRQDKTRPLIQRGAIIHIYDTDDIARDKLAAVASVRQGRYGIEIKMHDKTKALELLGKHHRVFDDTQRVEHSGSINVVFGIPRPPRQQAQEEPPAEDVAGRD